MTEVTKALQVNFTNNNGSDIVIAVSNENGELKIKFLNNFKDYIEYRP